jgi:retron-type reverse transcriptase
MPAAGLECDCVVDLDAQKFFDEVPQNLLVKAVRAVSDCRWVVGLRAAARERGPQARQEPVCR